MNWVGAILFIVAFFIVDYKFDRLRDRVNHLESDIEKIIRGGHSYE